MNRRKNTHMSSQTRTIVALFLSLLMTAGICFAGSIDSAQIMQVRIDQEKDSRLIVDVMFHGDVADVSQLSSLGNYLLLDVGSERFVPLVGVLLRSNCNNVQLVIDPTVRLNSNSQLHLFVKSLQLQSDPASGLLDINIPHDKIK